MDKYEQILLKALKGDKFYTNEDIRFNAKHNILFSREDLEQYLKFKDEFQHSHKVELPLLTFNSSKIYYFKTNEILSILKDYFDIFTLEYFNTDGFVSPFLSEILTSQLASEIEGSGRLEGTNTTKKRTMEIIQNPNLVKKNEEDTLILNMIESYKYIFDKPKFNEENLFKLYNLLTKDLLSSDKKIKSGYYRKDMVYIANHSGCPSDQIRDCMNSLFDYVNKELNTRNFYLPFIAHYYMLYIHPYYDFNGRMARIISVWISLLSDSREFFPKFISEAINENKNDYYRAIDNSRASHNDLTYF